MLSRVYRTQRDHKDRVAEVACREPAMENQNWSHGFSVIQYNDSFCMTSISPKKHTIGHDRLLIFITISQQKSLI